MRDDVARELVNAIHDLTAAVLDQGRTLDQIVKKLEWIGGSLSALSVEVAVPDTIAVKKSDLR